MYTLWKSCLIRINICLLIRVTKLDIIYLLVKFYSSFLVSACMLLCIVFKVVRWRDKKTYNHSYEQAGINSYLQTFKICSSHMKCVALNLINYFLIYDFTVPCFYVFADKFPLAIHACGT